MKDFKGNELNIGDKVIFCKKNNMLAEGTIVDFFQYKDCSDEECAIQTATSKIINIHSSNIFKLED